MIEILDGNGKPFAQKEDKINYVLEIELLCDKYKVARPLTGDNMEVVLHKIYTLCKKLEAKAYPQFEEGVISICCPKGEDNEI